MILVARYGPLLIAVLLCGCASSSVLEPVAYSWVDRPGERSIEVRYSNDSHRTRCLLPEHWPNAAGAIADAQDRVFLIVGDRRFSMKAFNPGYCLGKCSTVVMPGKEIRANIPYEHFDLPEQLINESKQLEFSPAAFDCRTK